MKAEYFKTGDEAEKIADEVGQKMATVNTETLKVRSEASLEASVIGLVPGGEELSVLDEENGFVKVSIEEGDGWVSEDYVVVATEYVTAESIEEEKARIAEEEKARAVSYTHRRIARLACGKLRRNIRYETIEQGKLDSAGVLQRRGNPSLLSGAADFDAAARSGKRQ